MCFLGGNMALGWLYKKDLTYLLDMAKELTKTCYEMYAKQATGLSPEIAYFNTDAQSNEPTLSVRVSPENGRRASMTRDLFACRTTMLITCCVPS